MGLESFEGIKIESIVLGDNPQSKEVAPLKPLTNIEWQEEHEVILESSDVVESLFPSLESFRNNGVERLEILHDSEVTEQIAEYLGGLEELRYENWRLLSMEERKALLNRIENQIAAIEHRPPLPIEVKKLNAKTFGYQDNFFHKIALNSLYVGSDSKEDYLDVIDTIIHEGRHAYQHYNVDKKLIHESASVVETWKQNFYDPKYKYYNGDTVIIPIKGRLQDVGFRLYYYQPVEIDARNFASDVILKLKQKGFIS